MYRNSRVYDYNSFQFGYGSKSYYLFQLKRGYNRLLLDTPYVVFKDQFVWLNQNSSGKVGLDTSGQSPIGDLYIDCNPFCYKLHRINEQTNHRFYVRAIYKPLSSSNINLYSFFSYLKKKKKKRSVLHYH